MFGLYVQKSLKNEYCMDFQPNLGQTNYKVIQVCLMVNRRLGLLVENPIKDYDL